MARTQKPKADQLPRTPKKTPQKPKPEPTSDSEMPKAAAGKRGTKTRGAGKKKDPNAPKRGLSAYMFYANENRDRVRKENEDASFGQIGKLLGDEWKSLTPEKKSKYDDMAAKDKKRYEDEKAKYMAGDDEEGSD